MSQSGLGTNIRLIGTDSQHEVNTRTIITTVSFQVLHCHEGNVELSMVGN